jgi:hypothetical protein
VETKTVHPHLPTVAPSGFAFKLRTIPNAVDPKHRYFQGSLSGGKGRSARLVFSVLADRAKTFAHLALAESFATFVNNKHLFPDAPKFEIVIERAGYSSESLRLTTLAE